MSDRFQLAKGDTGPVILLDQHPVPVEDIVSLLNQGEKDIQQLRAALIDFIGVESEKELGQLEMATLLGSESERDKTTVINAVKALRETG